MNRKKSEQLFEIAKEFFPGGVNSPVRAFKSVGGSPLFIKKGDGCRIWDEDDNEFIDFCCSWGPLILGHNNPHVNAAIKSAVDNGSSFGTPTALENQLADLILSNNPYIEKLRFVSSGTEATMSAIRLARGYTGRNKIIKFEGCYHGHSDGLLVKAGSGLATLGTSSSAGVPDSYANETIVLPLHDKQTIGTAVSKYKNDIACIIIEPIPANNGLLLQGSDYLQFLRNVCDKEGILLFFDEVISGFRVGFTGAAGYYAIKPDLIAYGKIIGGGLPVGAYAANAEIMGHVAPDGDVYQAGTLSGNPVAMAAGIAQLSACIAPGFYDNLEQKTKSFVAAINNHAMAKGYDFNITTVASIFWLNFAKQEAHAAADIDGNNMSYFAQLHALLLERGVYLGPSGYEVGFISDAHTSDDLQNASAAICECLDLVLGK